MLNHELLTFLKENGKQGGGSTALLADLVNALVSEPVWFVVNSHAAWVHAVHDLEVPADYVVTLDDIRSGKLQGRGRRPLIINPDVVWELVNEGAIR